MNERIKELVAIGASAAVNCHACMEHHLALCRKHGATPEDIAAAVEVGLMVNRGAHAKTRAVVGSLGTGKAATAGGCCG